MDESDFGIGEIFPLSMKTSRVIKCYIERLLPNGTKTEKTSITHA